MSLTLQTTLACATALRKTARHWTQHQITWDEILSWTPAQHRECGSYVLGVIEPSTEEHTPGQPCTALHRNKHTVVSRSALTLDVDSATPSWLDEWLLLWSNEALIHTTHHSTPDAPRYRLIIPLARPVTPEEYVALAERVLGDDPAFDPSTTQPERFMFKPSAEHLENYHRVHVTGPWMDPDEVLAASGYVTSVAPQQRSVKRDPLELQGIPGAFNRVYTNLDRLIEAYQLPYERVADNRWTLRGSESPAGMGPIHGAEHLWYSHHSTDPAGGRAVSAFDLVRLHRFGELDADAEPDTPVNRLPSHDAMCDYATRDAAVVRELFGPDLPLNESEPPLSPTPAEPASTAPPADGWLTRLKLNKAGDALDSVRNLDLIAANDRLFTGLAYNEMTLAVEAKWLPWRDVDRHPDLSEADMSALWLYVEREYRLKVSQARLSALVAATALRRSRHPVREYLQALEWDGTPRLEESLPGVVPTEFTRFVARKCIVGAAARMLNPGCKVDQVLILQGGEGLGKTSWIERMSRGWFSQLGDIHNKDTLLSMQRSWLVVADEGYWLRKSDASALKDFITRTADTFRTPYDRHARTHWRHSTIWGSVNERAVLRDQEGNRRFMIVHCAEKMDFARMTDEYIDQVWAEAVALYRAGERLWLTTEEEAWCRSERDPFIADSGRFGVVQEYLNTLVPEGWDGWPLESRQLWLRSRSDDLVEAGAQPITSVCAVQLWAEALGHRMSDPQSPSDLQELREIMDRMPGWTASLKKRRLPQYGVQRVWTRG